MSKRNIKHPKGKQLYLNQIFYKGMLYTSSEMQEGFAKIIDNYDIAPTGDSASPRYPLIMQDICLGSDSEDIIPIQFKQDDKFSYVKFKRVISESEYVNDTLTSTVAVNFSTGKPSKQIQIIRRDKQEFSSDDTISINNIDITSYTLYEDISISPITDDEAALIDWYQGMIERYSPLDVNLNNNNEVVYIDITSRYYDPTLPISNYFTYSNLTISSSNSYSYLLKTGSDLNSDITIDIQNQSPTIYVADGDTIHITLNNTTTKYRLYGVDTPEIKTNDMWATCAKKVLETIFTKTQSAPNFIKIKNVTIDVYGRQVAKIYLGWGNSANSAKYIELSCVILSLGIGVIRYLTLPTDNEDYIACSDYAIEHNLKIYSDTDFDPYHTRDTINTNHKLFQLSEKDNLQLTSSQYIEIVSLNDSYAISAKTNIKTKKLSAVYVDYLDSIAFIGRIIDTSTNPYSITYKGIILLRCVLDLNNNPIYIIQLPSNQGEGVKPDIITATTNGSYNISNTNMINIANNTDTFKAFDIIGITALNSQNGKLIEPYEIVTQVNIGKQICLKAILNENGYYPYNDTTTTDLFGFDVVVAPIKLAYVESGISIKYIEVMPSRTIHKEVGDYSNQTILSYDIKNIKQVLTNLDTSIKRKVLESLELVNSTDTFTNEEQSLDYKIEHNVTWDVILNHTHGSNNQYIQFNSITLFKNNNEQYTLSLNAGYQVFNNYESIRPFNITQGSVLEVLIGCYKNYNDDNDMLGIVVYNNFSTINMSFNGTKQLSIREQSLPLYFYQQWFTANYGSTSYTPITNSELIYIKETGSSNLTKTNIWDTYPVGVLKPTDCFYTMEYNNAQFKYSIQPKIKNKLSERCPDVFADILLENTYQEIYRTIPIIKVDNTLETVSDMSLRQNMDFKNATRIDVFNRQLCVYGPYTISNVLFFSQFEVFDYFPLPSHIIELDEPIITVYNYKDSLIVMGKYSIYMLSGATSILECKLNKIYENLSTHLADVNCLATSGNNMIFFNDGMGYVIVPNIYVDNSSNIKIYKLTEYISNFFYNPEEFIRLKFNYNIDSNITYYMELKTYVQNNEIIIAVNIEAYGTIETTNNVQHKIVVWFIYDQNYKYWRMYSSQLFDEIKQIYICEPQLNNQFLVKKGSNNYIVYFKYLWGTEYSDKNKTGESETKLPITTTINSGYLSVDTMNDKRFKDIILELDNIDPSARLTMKCDFFIDGSPILLSDTDILVIDKLNNQTNITSDEVEDVFDKEYVSDVHHLFTTDGTNNQQKLFGKLFVLDNTVYSITGRTHIRIPVFGKGRLPLFNLQIQSDKFYEFINYSMIYKEKDINRRA